jgi:hypothetical protein
MATHLLDHVVEVLQKAKGDPKNKLPYQNVNYVIQNTDKGVKCTISFDHLSPSDQAKFEAMQAQGGVQATPQPQEPQEPQDELAAERAKEEEPKSKAAAREKVKVALAGKKAAKALDGKYPEQFLRAMGIGGN